MKKIVQIERITPHQIFAIYPKNQNGSHSRAFFKTREDFSFQVSNHRNLFLVKGDLVEIIIEPAGAIAVSFSMFIMPLISFIIFYSISGLLIHNGEFLKILTGISGILFSFALTYLIFKIRPQKLPKITRKLSTEEQKSCSIDNGCGSCTSCG